MSTSAHDERAPAAVANPDGGMTVVFELAIAGEDGASEEVDIYAQRLSAHGRLLWNEGRRSSPACAVVYPERHPVAVSDGRGGTVVLATMNAPDTAKLSGAVLLVAQHLDARGRRTWKGGKGVLPVAASSKPPLRPAAVLLSTARAE